MTTYLVKGFSHKYPDVGVFIFVDGPDEADFSPQATTEAIVGPGYCFPVARTFDDVHVPKDCKNVLFHGPDDYRQDIYDQITQCHAENEAEERR